MPQDPPINDFDEELARLSESVLRLAWYLLPDYAGRNEDAEDIAQESLLLAKRHQGSFNGDTVACLRSWVYSIVRRTVVEHMRRPRRVRQEAATEEPESDDKERDWADLRIDLESEAFEKLLSRHERYLARALFDGANIKALLLDGSLASQGLTRSGAYTSVVSAKRKMQDFLLSST